MAKPPTFQLGLKYAHEARVNWERRVNPRALQLAKLLSRTCGSWLPPLLLSRSLPGIPGPVHLDDAMLRSDAPEHVRHYLEDALSAIANIEESLRAVGRDWDDVASCLDLPSGYGRVTRHLVARLGAGRVTACDLDHDAVRFCAAAFGVTPLASHERPASIVFPNTYDLIFVGSLITHLPVADVFHLLAALVGALRPNGLLIFTTQGESCLEHLDWYGADFARIEHEYRRHLAEQGHHFSPYARSARYGVALHARRFIEAEIRARHGGHLELVRFSERGWDRHQDVWTYKSPSKVLREEGVRAAPSPS
jgi:SAM-dependent methyltransferase